MPQPTLSTSRMVLVPLDDEHLEQELDLDSDPEMLRYLFPEARSRAEVVEAQRRRLAGAGAADGLGVWMGHHRTDDGRPGDWIGLFMLTPPDEASAPPAGSDPAGSDPAGSDPAGSDPDGGGNADARDRADLDYRVRRSLWRQGLATEGALALLRHGFETVGLRSVRARTTAVDRPARATMEALGLVLAPAAHAGAADEPEGVDVEYAMTREQWQALPGPG